MVLCINGPNFPRLPQKSNHLLMLVASMDGVIWNHAQILLNIPRDQW